jgi:hypothetical protein
MAKALGTDPKNLSDRKLWELLRTRTTEISQREREGVRRELFARGQLLPARVFHPPR